NNPPSSPPPPAVRIPAQAGGPGPAADQPVLAVHGPPVAWHPRPEPVLRRVGRFAHPGPAPAYAVADRLRRRARRGDQRSARHDRGDQERRDPRPRRPYDSAAWSRDAAILGGDPARERTGHSR